MFKTKWAYRLIILILTCHLYFAYGQYSPEIIYDDALFDNKVEYKVLQEGGNSPQPPWHVSLRYGQNVAEQLFSSFSTNLSYSNFGQNEFYFSIGVPRFLSFHLGGASFTVDGTDRRDDVEYDLSSNYVLSVGGDFGFSTYLIHALNNSNSIESFKHTPFYPAFSLGAYFNYHIMDVYEGNDLGFYSAIDIWLYPVVLGFEWRAGIPFLLQKPEETEASVTIPDDVELQTNSLYATLSYYF